MSLKEKQQEWKKNKNKIIIGVDDWVEKLGEYLREEEIEFDSERKLIEFEVKHNLSSRQMGEITLAAQQQGLLDDDIFDDFKITLSTGRQDALSHAFNKERIRKELENGKSVEVRKYFGNIKGMEENGEEPSNDENPAPILTLSKDGIERVKRYIRTQFKGDLYNRLKELKAWSESEKDESIFTNEIAFIRSMIDEMEEKLS